MAGGGFDFTPGFTPNGNLHGAHSGTMTVVTASQNPIQAIGSNPDRVGLILYNNTSADAFVGFGVAAGTTVSTFTIRLAPSGSWSAPSPIYCGPVSVIFDGTQNANLILTETV
jgi:hypothetical protein